MPKDIKPQEKYRSGSTKYYEKGPINWDPPLVFERYQMRGKVDEIMKSNTFKDVVFVKKIDKNGKS